MQCFESRAGSVYRDEITKVILQLQEDDVLLELKNKWWKSDQCHKSTGQSDEANSLGLRNIGGIFLVLITGLVCGLIAAFAEFIWKSRQNAMIDRVSPSIPEHFRFSSKQQCGRSVQSDTVKSLDT